MAAGKEFFSNEPLYFWETNSLERLAMQYCPLELGINSAPNMQTVQVVGRNNAFYFYTSGEETMNMQLDYCAEKSDFSDVKAKVNWLRSWRYNEGMAKPPGRFKLVFGKMFGNEIWAIKAIQIRYSHFKNYTIPEMRTSQGENFEEAGNPYPGRKFAIGKNTDYYASQAHVDIVLGLAGIGNTKNIRRSQIHP